MLGGLVAGGVDLAAQYTQAKLAGKHLAVNWPRTGVAFAFGFATSGVSAFMGGKVASLGLSAAESFTLRTAGNAGIGALANMGSTATLNKLQGTNDSLGKAAGWGGLFGGLGSALGDSFPAASAALNQREINALSPAKFNLLSGIAETSGRQLGGASPTWTAAGVQFGNAVGSLTSFVPGDSDKASPSPIKPVTQ